MAEGMQILVHKSEEYIETALLHSGSLLEYDRREQNGTDLVGTVMLGRVERVLPDVKAAFVNIGRKLNGFLPIREAESYHAINGKSPLVTGADVIVQVKKDEKGGKGAFLTRDITLPGQYLLLLPMSRFVGVSKRIEDPAEHAAAKALGKTVAQDRFGVIIRHSALFARLEDVRQEAEALYKNWQAVIAHANMRKSPAVLLEERPYHEILARDYSARYSLQLCAEEGVAAVEHLPQNVAFSACDGIAMEALWQGNHVTRQLRNALERKVQLPGGASLVIDEREALHTIDVNSGGNVSAQEGMSLALTQNLSAAGEIARQIRLRNLSGIILVDFIDMENADEQARLQAAMEEALSADRIKTVVHGFTSLGLLELTRKRTASALREVLTVPCSHCGGTGYQNLP
ncbi:MAG: ribonuclease E/G [Clostridia bacterium]|nr:ribonuclease E/G [Clostridia bacterium]